MGSVVPFPAYRRPSRAAAAPIVEADIVILPVVRIVRGEMAPPASGVAQGYTAG